MPAAFNPRLGELVAAPRANWCSLDERIASFYAEFTGEFEEDAAAGRIPKFPGFGPTNAIDLAAAMSRGETFSRRHDLAAARGSRPLALRRRAKLAKPLYTHQLWFARA